MMKIDFIKNRNKYLIFSGILLAIILVFLFINNVNLAIEFKGGSIITYSYEGDLDLNDLGDKINEVNNIIPTFQKSESIATGQQTVIVTMPGNNSLSSDQLMALNNHLSENFSANELAVLEINNVNPTMGREFLAKSMVAIAVSFLLMLVYVGYRFRRIGGLSTGAMAVLALLHDVIVAFGVFVIFRIPLDDNFIAVVLTILGFSLNDTIVIFDRIRENEKLHGQEMPLGELVNLSINQSFKRSIVTSFTAFLAMIVVTIVALSFNVDSILPFSFPLIIGLASGSYSTICLAGPLWVLWQERKAKKA